MKIKHLNTELSDNIKQIIKLQEELSNKMFSNIGIKSEFFGGFLNMRCLTREEEKALELAFRSSLLKKATLKNRK